MAKYKGVLTRRLNGYINLFVFQYALKQILTNNELNEYLHESLLDIDKLFKELRSEGLFDYSQ
jgi:hypothetical protein